MGVKLALQKGDRRKRELMIMSEALDATNLTANIPGLLSFS